METKNKHLDFTDQNIYVGLDAHKKQFTVSIQSEYLFHKTFSQPPKPEVLVNYLRRNFPGANYCAAYEAGYSGFWIQEKLQEFGVNCIVVNPADVPTTDKEKKQKRDPMDSRKIAKSLKSGQLTAIHIPDKNRQHDRSFLRTRQSIVGNQTRCRNRIKAFLNFYGIEFPEQFQKSGTHWSSRFIGWLKQLDLGYEIGNDTLGVLLKEAEFLRSLILQMDRGIRKLSREKRYLEDAKLLISVPGIGTLTAMILLTELGDITRFPDNNRLCSYLGLIPNVNSSGDRESAGEITSRSNGHLRYLIVESSWTAARNDPALSMKFNKLCATMTGNKAIIRVARSLVNRIRFVLKNKKGYVNLVNC